MDEKYQAVALTISFAAVACLVFYFIGMYVGSNIKTVEIQQEAITAHVAHYDPITGKFKWGAP